MLNYTKSKNTYFATPKDDVKDKISLEVGDSKQPDFKPQQKIMRWDNEVNVSLRLVHDEKTPTVSKKGEVITWDGEKVKAEIYPLTEDEGGNEFEISLKYKPKTNVVQFTLVDKGVEYFYQPPLIEEIKVGDEDGRIVEVTETDAFDKDGNSIIHRPENVVGSYAIYASENKVNYVGGKEYKCGKVGHIFRPRIEDTMGNWVWGDLNIKDGILSVTIPQEFLDNAVYPVRHAAGLTFGYTTTPIGGMYAVEANRVWGPNGTITGAAGTATSISVCANRGTTGTSQMQMAIYSASNPSNLLTNGYTNSANFTRTKAWITATFTTNPTISETGYYLLANQNYERYAYYDSGGDSGWAHVFRTFNTWQNETFNMYNSNYRLGYYVTYTAGASTSIKSINGLAKASIKSINGLAIASVKSFNGLT